MHCATPFIGILSCQPQCATPLHIMSFFFLLAGVQLLLHCCCQCCAVLLMAESCCFCWHTHCAAVNSHAAFVGTLIVLLLTAFLVHCCEWHWCHQWCYCWWWWCHAAADCFILLLLLLLAVVHCFSCCCWQLHTAFVVAVGCSTLVMLLLVEALCLFCYFSKFWQALH